MQTPDRYDGDRARLAFQRIAFATIDNGGGTFQRETGAEIDLQSRYGSGYVVAVQSFGDVDSCPLPSLWERIARVWPLHVAANVQYVGTWHDPKNARVCVDGVVVVSEREHALLLARKHEQDAIFNIQTGESEYIDAYTPIADDDGDTFAEVRDLIEELHDRLYGDVPRTIVDDSVTIDDRATWIVERLRVLTDAEYAECAYGDEDEDEDEDE